MNDELEASFRAVNKELLEAERRRIDDNRKLMEMVNAIADQVSNLNERLLLMRTGSSESK